MVFRRTVAAGLVAAGVALAPAQAATDVTESLVKVAPAGPGSWAYAVGGRGRGGTVLGTFSGTGIDLDGQLNSFAGEVTGFTMVLSGGTIVGGFALGFTDLFRLVYGLNGGSLGDGTGGAIEGIGASASGLFFAIGPGPFALCDGAAACSVIQGPVAAVIPGRAPGRS